MEVLGPTAAWFMTQGVLGVLCVLSLALNAFLGRLVLRLLEKRADEAETRTTATQTSLQEATASRLALTTAVQAQDDNLKKVLEYFRIQEAVQRLTGGKDA